MDFGRGNEVPTSAQRIAGRIIMRVGRGHIIVDTDRPFGGNSGRQQVADLAQATLAEPTVGSTRTRRLFAVAIR